MQSATAEKSAFPLMTWALGVWPSVLELFALHKERSLIWVPIAFSLGVFFYFSLKFEPPVFWGPLCASIALAAWGLSWRGRNVSDVRRGLWLVSGAVFLIAFGFGAAQMRTALVHTAILDKALGPVQVEGSIERLEKLEGGNGSRAVLSDLSVEKLSAEDTPRKIRIHIRKDSNLEAGARISVLAKLNPPSPPVSPGAFDFQRYAYFRGLGAVGFAFTEPEILEIPQKRAILTRIEGLQESIITRIESAMPHPQAAVAMALITGERGAITEDDTEAMRASGLAHLLAISGLHVGMVAGIIFFMTRFLMVLSPWAALHLPVKKMAAVLALLGAFFYMVLVGAPVPTQRAMIMTGLALLAIMLDRSPVSLRLVAIAAFGVLLLAPESLLSVSFQMSFAAVTMLIWFYDSIRVAWSKWYRHAGFLRKFALYFVGVAMTTVIASFATAPFALYHFQRFALYGVLANALAVPAMAFIVMPAALMSLLLMPFGLEAPALYGMEQGVGWILSIAHSTAEMEGSTLLVPSWPPVALTCVVLGTFIVILFKGRIRAASIGFLALSLLSISFYKQPDIQISSDNSLFSVRGSNDVLLLSSRMADKYAAENWLRRNGQEEDDKTKLPYEAGTQDLNCDGSGCHWEHKGHQIAFSYTAKTQGEDCAWADIVIAKDPVKRRACEADIVLDRFSIWREGAHALWLRKGHKPVVIKTDKAVRGSRPWTPYSP